MLLLEMKGSGVKMQETQAAFRHWKSQGNALYPRASKKRRDSADISLIAQS
jgi:hypothetical protein